ncbi:hypothetical protein LCGC14_1686810, partial [marine sediment metagenome]
MIISPRVTSPNYTDFSSLSALLAGPRFAGKTGEDLAVALWELLVDEQEGIYHFWPPTERLTGRKVRDPLKLLNCFGWCLCGDNANLLATLHKAAGLEDARCVGLKGHVVEEAYYDGAWHLLDADLRAFHRRHPPEQDTIASGEDCMADATLILSQQHPSDPFYRPDVSLENMAGLYDCAASTWQCVDEHVHTMDFVLRPGERLVRGTQPEGKWTWFDSFAEASG